MKILSILPKMLVCCLAFSALQAQDIIHKNDGDKIKARIKEIGSTEIRYELYKQPESPILVIDKQAVERIEFQNGHVEIITEVADEKAVFAKQFKHNLKLNFLSPLMGYTEFAYERNLKPGRSVEYELGIIGLGKNPDSYSYSYNPTTGEYTSIKSNPAGAYVGLSYKFYNLSSKNRSRTSKLFNGFYLQPEVDLGYFTQNIVRNNRTEREGLFFGGLLLNLGYQRVFGDVLMLDLYTSLGYGFDTQDRSSSGDYVDVSSQYYAFFKENENFGLALSGGIKLGFLFNTKPKKK